MKKKITQKGDIIQEITIKSNNYSFIQKNSFIIINNYKVKQLSLYLRKLVNDQKNFNNE